MRKLRIAFIVCLTVAAVPAALYGSVWLWIWHKTAQVENFYQAHSLLREMRAVQSVSTNDSGPARDALLRMLPLGMEREGAVTVLLREGLGCQTMAELATNVQLAQRFMEARGLTTNQNDNRTRKSWVDCQAETPNIVGIKHWIVDLQFDADGRLGDARIAIWNIFL